MNEKTLKILDFDIIKERLANEAESESAKKRALDLFPCFSPGEIEILQEEIEEALSVLIKEGSFRIGAFYDIKSSVSLAKIKGILTPEQLLKNLYNLKCARKLKTFFKNSEDVGRRILELSDAIEVIQDLENEIDRCILSEDEISDSASPELRKIRREINLINESLKSKINQIMNTADERSLLMDAVVTIRNGRYVIPLKAEHRSKIDGIIHDQSQKGSTLFIEPKQIVDMNNKLSELKLEESKEIHRILKELSNYVGEYSDILENNQDILTDMDFIFAKAKLAEKQKAHAPTITERSLVLKNARHPMIEEKKVVPISLNLGDDYDSLVITGPNTGGKTVSLKTTGLLILMAQSGLHIPADSGSKVPVLKKIFADIGDEQSIEQSLSTFSSHMANITDILKEADSETLVLLDELGAGTDPTEGAALAISILDYLQKKGSLTMATTHYAELKKYAISAKRVKNAAMTFDIDTLSPTYRLMLGAIGKSNAFAIAKKLGLSDEILNHAESLLEQDDIRFEDVIASVSEDKQRAEEELLEAISLRRELENKVSELERERRKISERKESILEKARAEAKEMIDETKAFADQMKKELKSLEIETDKSMRDRTQEEVRRKIREKSKDFYGNKEEIINLKPLKKEDLKIGDYVLVITLNKTGRLIMLSDDKKDAQVQVGSLKLNVSTDLLAKSSKKNAAENSGSKRSVNYMRTAVSSSINVIGKNLDDACHVVDKYIDDAWLAGLNEVSIIHGRGEGILKEGLHKMLKGNKHISSFRPGNYNEGGEGVTIVKLEGRK